MDSLETNKVIAAVLVAGIAFFVAGTIADQLIVQPELKHTVLKIEGAPATVTSSEPKPVALPPLAPLLAKADVKKGEDFAHKVCAACHTFNQGGKPGVGPNLYGIVGDPHAHEKGFDYSDAIKSKKGPWTYAELNEWLHKPSSYAPGTRMPFAGIPQAQLRADVIAFLKSISPKAPPFPKPEAAAPAKPASTTPAAANAVGGKAAGTNPAPAKPAPAASAPAAPAPAASAPAAPAPAAPAPAAPPAKQ
ncbi:MAG TPA: c-type cytochrome [Acetobacteraceae bacterium]|nr:c-type cytochrome [Acetobacteraceae bacterium]